MIEILGLLTPTQQHVQAIHSFISNKRVFPNGLERESTDPNTIYYLVPVVQNTGGLMLFNIVDDTFNVFGLAATHNFKEAYKNLYSIMKMSGSQFLKFYTYRPGFKSYILQYCRFFTCTEILEDRENYYDVTKPFNKRLKNRTRYEILVGFHSMIPPTE